MTESHYQHFVGIDISKRTLDVALLQHEQTHALQVANHDNGFAKLIQWLKHHHASADATIVCMENTGLYDDHLLEAMTISGYPCALEKTTCLAKVRPEHHRKNDRFDAALLAEYALRFQDKLTLWKAPEPVIEEIRLLYGERRRFLTQRGAVVQLQPPTGVPIRTLQRRSGMNNDASMMSISSVLRKSSMGWCVLMKTSLIATRK